MFKQVLRGGLLSACFLAPAQAGTFNDANPQPQEISYCFIGNALATQPARVSSLEDALNELSQYGNLKFTRHAECRRASNGEYTTDIRVVIPAAATSTHTNPYGISPVPGCDKENVGPSWGQPSTSRKSMKSCLFNVKIGNDNYADHLARTGSALGDPSGGSTPFKDHALHEFGHALGLGHEHSRRDTAEQIKAVQDSPGNSTSYITPYDPKSVMHYTYPGKESFAPGNYANKGLSTLDKVSLRVLFPESDLKADFSGNTTLIAGKTANLTVANLSLGAHSSVYKNYEWKLNGRLKSRGPTASLKIINPGRYRLSLSYKDAWNRSFLLNTSIEVISEQVYKKRMSSSTANNLLLSN
ncbi:MAG: M12 family metallopeptidase [Synechococcus sp.]|nr:M12 family metallopeptidase [Synechococcus sp.]